MLAQVAINHENIFSQKSGNIQNMKVGNLKHSFMLLAIVVN
jgi:hypothetical protein